MNEKEMRTILFVTSFFVILGLVLVVVQLSNTSADAVCGDMFPAKENNWYEAKAVYQIEDTKEVMIICERVNITTVDKVY